MSDSAELAPSHIRLFTLEEVAELTGLSIVTLRRLLRVKQPAKRLNHHRIGRSIRVSQADLEEYLARCRKSGR